MDRDAAVFGADNRLTEFGIGRILYLTLPADASRWVGLTVKEADGNNGEGKNNTEKENSW